MRGVPRHHVHIVCDIEQCTRTCTHTHTHTHSRWCICTPSKQWSSAVPCGLALVRSLSASPSPSVSVSVAVAVCLALACTPSLSRSYADVGRVYIVVLVPAGQLCGEQLAPDAKIANPIAAVNDGSSALLYVVQQRGLITAVDLDAPGDEPLLWMNMNDIVYVNQSPGDERGV